MPIDDGDFQDMFGGRQAQLQTSANIDEEPDNAGRAIALEQATGIPAPIIHQNLEDYERQTKLQMANTIVGNNPYLQTYVTSNPMAAKVSNDDFAQMDSASQAVQKIGKQSVFGAALSGFKEGWGGPIGEWAMQRPQDVEFSKKYPGTTALLMTAGGALEVPMKLMNAWTQAATQGAGQWAVNMGITDKGVEYGKQFGEAISDPGLWASIHPALGELAALMHGRADATKAFNDAARSTGIYIDANRDVPVGHSPITDMVKAEEADLDLGNLKEALRESVASSTRERAPELFRQFLRDHTDAKIGISPEAIDRLYGDKVPTVTDGKLGWVPRLGEQVELARAAGTDVEVPLADFLAKADPKILDEIEDGIRVRADGLTKEEAEAIGAEAKDGIEAGVDVDRPEPKPVDVVRANAGLTPITAFHGTPHEFSAFDIGKVGTGEGAQSYGHGLYFAEKPEVAESYKSAGVGGQHTVGGKPFNPNDPVHVASKALDEFGSPEDALIYLRNSAAAARKRSGVMGEPEAKKFEAAQQLISKGDKLPQYGEPVGANLYRVRIHAEKEHFLDWDKPLSEQPKILEKIGNHDLLGDVKIKGDATGEDFLLNAAAHLSGTEIGEGDLIQRFGNLDKHSPELSKLLHEAGIPGIKYLDQGSRIPRDEVNSLEAQRQAYIEQGAKGKDLDVINAQIERAKQALDKGTRNYVLFDDKLAEITHVNDVPTEAEVARQAESAKPKSRYRRPKQLELDLKQLDERDAFEKASAIGMTVDQYKRYLRLIEKQRMADYEAEVRSRAKEESRRQTEEWRQNEAAMRSDVIERLRQRPDIIADKFFREGQLYGETLEEKPRLNPEHLTEAQRAALPRSFQAARGMHPDDAAGLLGYPTGDALVVDLAKLHADRLSAGGRPDEFFRKMVNAETAVEMEKKYGSLKGNILREAQELALSATQIEMLHEETLALATKAGGQFEIGADELRAWIKDRFDRTGYSDVSVDKYLAAAGKAGRATEVALLKGDFAEAFRQKQRQYLSVRLAAEAKEFVKAQEKFEAVAKRFSAREVSPIAQEYTDQIHDLLMRIGEPVKRSVQDLQDAQRRNGYTSIDDFAKKKAEASLGLINIPVPEYLADPTWRRPLSEMSVADFRELKDLTDVLVKLGRDQERIITTADNIEKAQLVKAMSEQLSTFPLHEYPITKTPLDKVKSGFRTFIAASTNIETLLNRWDRGDPNGVFNRYIVYPLMKAANEKARLIREYARPYGELGEVKDAKKLVESPIIDPLSITDATPDGFPLARFTRGNVMTMIHNAGNPAQWEKFARGWGADPDYLLRWLIRNSDKAMWDRAQKTGDTIFKPLFERAQEVYRRIEGIASEKIELKPFDVTFPDGTKASYEGWYHPLIKDATREAYFDAEGNRISGVSKDQMGGAIFDKTDNFHARTANGYTKSRTNVVYPVDLNPDMIPVRLTQMIHDIAFREAIINTEKIFGDQKFRAEVTKFYGEEYAAGLMPFLRGVAGQEGLPSKAYGMAQRISEYLRQNVISTYIGFNPFTAMKHGPTALVMSVKQVGAAEFLQAVRDLYSRSEDINLTNKEFVDKWSQEVNRRHRHWQDTIAGEHANIYSEGTFREKMIEKGSWLVSQSDMMSVRPTWLAAYRNAIAEGIEHASAVDQADAAVRKAHGSTAVTNQPALVRGGGPLHGWLTSIYGFFGTVMQRRIELAHAINDAYKLGREGEIRAAAKQVPSIAAQVMTYVIWPTLVEEYVSGLTTEDRKGWGHHIIKGALLGLSSPVLYLRDVTHGLVTGKDPGAGLISSPLHDVGNLMRDLGRGKKMFSKEHAGKLVQDTVTVFGEATGRTPKELGNVARFGIDLANRQQNPRTLGDWFRGATRGNIKKYEVK